MHPILVMLIEALIIEIPSSANFAVKCRELVKVLEVFWCTNLEIVSNDATGTFS